VAYGATRLEAGKCCARCAPECHAAARAARTFCGSVRHPDQISGLKTQYCVDSTCRVAADSGLRTVLVADAHTCMDTPPLPAASIIAHHNATLMGAFAQLRETEAITF
jgi:hypothetical protein